MKYFLFIVMLVFVASPVDAQEKGFGLGIILGEPTGLSAKTWTSGNNAIDAGLAWSFRGRGFFHLHADYLWHFPNAITSSERFVPYVGVGGRFGAVKRDGILGIRVVGGLAYWPRGVPLDVFVEFAPILDLIPATEMSANGGIGARFYF
ncbi:MAG: hypothetical protein ACKVRP_13985 [Bacteroidota bacterium]